VSPASYLLDTNVVSELRRARPDERVVAWYSSVAAADLYLSVLTVGEIEQGIRRLAPRDPDRAAVLTGWLDELTRGFADRILPVTSAVARRWAMLDAARTLPVVDSLIGATAVEHGAVLVTRNVRDLAGSGVPVLDPFAAPGPPQV
jgi:predicted nucleic acid-binding protein